MSDGLSILAKIQANAAIVVRIAGEQLGENIGYNEAGVRWLDGYIQRQHEGGDPSNHAGLINPLGSYLGECVIQSFGGEWAEVEGAWSVRFDDRNAVYPFAKVAKQRNYPQAADDLGAVPRVAKPSGV
jgi:hypothetical protein